MTNDRSLIDPEDRYPASGLRAVESQALRVLELLPGATVERTRDVIQIDWGGEAGIVVLVTREAVEVRLPGVEWTCGAYGPAVTSRLWKRSSLRKLSSERLRRLLAAAQEARLAEFEICRYCNRSTAPEHRIQDDICHGCAERHLGVVF